MTVSELFKKYDFESILPHLNHLFMENSGRHFSDASIEVFRDLYKHWTECETKPTKCHIRLVSRWEHTSPSTLCKATLNLLHIFGWWQLLRIYAPFPNQNRGIPFC